MQHQHSLALPGSEVQELKQLKDAAKRAGKKSKDEFRAKEAELLKQHDAELSQLEASASTTQAETAPETAEAPQPADQSMQGERKVRLPAKLL